MSVAAARTVRRLPRSREPGRASRPTTAPRPSTRSTSRPTTTATDDDRRDARGRRRRRAASGGTDGYDPDLYAPGAGQDPAPTPECGRRRRERRHPELIGPARGRDARGVAPIRLRRGLGMSVIGEFELIDAVRERSRAAGAERIRALVVGSGDDAAITVARRRRRRRASTRSSRAFTSDAAVHAAAGRPQGACRGALGPGGDGRDGGRGLRAARAFRPTATTPELLELADGLAAAGRRSTASRSSVATSPARRCCCVAVTVVAPRRIRRRPRAPRSGAAAGRLVVVTGELGGAAAGLALLERPELAERLGRPKSPTLCACASSSRSRGSPRAPRSRAPGPPR